MALQVNLGDGTYDIAISDEIIEWCWDVSAHCLLPGTAEYKPWTWRQRWAWKLNPSTLRWKLAKRIYPEGFEADW